MNNKGTKQSCTCDECKRMCKRPCWGTPEDIQAIIDAGYGTMIMLDYWVGGGIDDNDILIPCPSEVGSECQRTSSWFGFSGCVFQDSHGLCMLHDLGLKPTEGKEAFCDGSTDGGLHENVAMTWNTPKGRKVADNWIKEYMIRS